jgi:hypothetical protein
MIRINPAEGCMSLRRVGATTRCNAAPAVVPIKQKDG